MMRYSRRESQHCFRGAVSTYLLWMGLGCRAQTPITKLSVVEMHSFGQARSEFFVCISENFSTIVFLFAGLLPSTSGWKMRMLNELLLGTIGVGSDGPFVIRQTHHERRGADSDATALT
jgi:hypothetical protein